MKPPRNVDFGFIAHVALVADDHAEIEIEEDGLDIAAALFGLFVPETPEEAEDNDCAIIDGRWRITGPDFAKRARSYTADLNEEHAVREAAYPWWAE